MKILDVPQSGSLGAQTSSHNRAGQYRRARRAPVQPVGTGRRAFIRTSFGTASSAWSGLTDPQRAAWAAYADVHPVTDSLGQSIKLTGHQMFVAISTQLLNTGEPIVNTPPVSDVIPPFAVDTFTATAAGIITLTQVAQDAPSGSLLIGLSKPMPAGRSSVAAYWQQTTATLGDATPLFLSAGYHAQFGLPVAGQKIFYRLTPVNAAGVTGVPLKGFIVVSA